MFEFQITSGAYNSNGDVPRSCWKTVSTHRKHSAAADALHDAVYEMRERCGYSAWDTNFRIITLTNTNLVTTFACNGCSQRAEVKTPWYEGEEAPHCDQPDGWYDSDFHGFHGGKYYRYGLYCEHCAEAARERDEYQQRIYDREAEIYARRERGIYDFCIHP